jgi:hypothetical protein
VKGGKIFPASIRPRAVLGQNEFGRLNEIT